MSLETYKDNSVLVTSSHQQHYDLPCPDAYDSEDAELNGLVRTTKATVGTIENSSSPVWKRWSQRVSVYLQCADVVQNVAASLARRQAAEQRPDTNGYDAVAPTEKERQKTDIMGFGHQFCKMF